MLAPAACRWHPAIPSTDRTLTLRGPRRASHGANGPSATMRPCQCPPHDSAPARWRFSCRHRPRLQQFPHGHCALPDGSAARRRSPARNRAHGRWPGWQGGLSNEARQRALECLARFGQRIRDVPSLRVRALATNTVRQLRSPQAFLMPAETALGHAIEVVSGREEARLIYLGVAHAQPPKPDQRRLVIDIGGGSTEFIIGRGFQTLERESLQAGCIASTRRFFPAVNCRRKMEGCADRDRRRVSAVRRPVQGAGLARGDRLVRHAQGHRRDVRGNEADQGRDHGAGAAGAAR